tara:strand:- start:632 stop:1018 length:387 start_codon:yes stop_codon:yes gene_type:complete
MRLEFVKNEPKYWEFIRGLRNDERVKHGFIQQEEIEAEQHINYMMAYGQCFHLCLVDDKPAGFVRVLADDIGVCTHPNFQKRGVGKFMVNEIMRLYPNAVAKIKLENEASVKLFESCGFVKKYYLLEK